MGQLRPASADAGRGSLTAHSGRVGLALGLLILGFVLQMVSNHPGLFGWMEQTLHGWAS